VFNNPLHVWSLNLGHGSKVKQFFLEVALPLTKYAGTLPAKAIIREPDLSFAR
jgi:hypothetical protein